MTDLLKNLNPDQQKVVRAIDGPVLVLAGAGSGKTRALTHRLAYIIAQGAARPDEMLAVTFTNKAAGEMRERVRRLLRGRLVPEAIGTFHSIGARLLRREARYLTRSARFTIGDAADSERLIRRALDDLSLARQQYHPRTLAAIISRAKNELIAPPALAEQARSTLEKVGAQVYMRYEEILQATDMYDFDDLLREPVQLLTRQPEVAAMYYERWRFLSVDEYQDTNPLQDRLLHLLLSPAKNICVVGDDYQAIYSWRGARVDHILQFEQRFPNCTTIYLTRNYRSTAAILSAANRVIAANIHQKHKELWTRRDAGVPVQAVALPSGRAEAAWIREAISDRVQRGGKLRDCVVLYRTNAQSRAFEEEFLTYRVPYTIVGGFRFYERREVKDALALLQITANGNGHLAVPRIAESLWRGIGPKTLAAWQPSAATEGWLSVLQRESVQRPVLQPAVGALAAASERTFETVGDQLDFLIRRSGYAAWLKRLPDAEEREENLAELINVASGYASVEQFLEDAALLTDLDTLEARRDRVCCMTLHAAKGLEFPAVFLVGCEEGLLPHENSLGNIREMEEERRLLYVGMTRAQVQLTLTYVAVRQWHGGVSMRSPSRFLRDLPESVATLTIEDEENSEVTAVQADELLWQGEGGSSFAVGEFITHESFGRGVVIGAKAGRVTCVFERDGVKTIDSAQATAEPA
ncbi:MAG: UvrD-helicase domain-containing protein [Candidatus Andersenbacteria bacterium]|nr:UvrD-helicase domain-containing protein [Candidatus Andersenbacteria bacterium]